MAIIVEEKSVDEMTSGETLTSYSQVRDFFDRLGIKVRHRSIESDDYVEGVSGWKLSSIGVDINVATAIKEIAIGTSPDWFKADTTGNIWSGDATLAGAKTNTFAVEKEGLLYCQGATIGGSAIDGTSTIGGRAGSVLAGAIDASGHFADAAISTATQTIIGAFTFGVSGALQIGTYAEGVTGDIKLSPTGILGRDKDNNTTFSLNATTGVAVLNGLVVGTNVGLGTAQDSAGVTTIIGDTVTTAFVNALDVNAATVSASISITTPNIIGGTGSFSGAITAGADSAIPLSYITESYTAGEDIVAGETLYLCKAGYTDINVTDDTYIDENNSSDTHCAEDDFHIYREDTGGYADKKVGLVKFPLTGLGGSVTKVVLRLYIEMCPSIENLWIRRITSDWSEASCPSWDTKPTWDTTRRWGQETIPAGSGWVEIDITELVREWIAGTHNNYGVAITGYELPAITISSSETGSNEPHIRAWNEGRGEGIDKVFKAKADDFLTCFPVVGIATESVSADEEVKVKNLGGATSNSNLTYSGDFAYVSTATAGELVNNLDAHTSSDFVVKVGTVKEGAANAEILLEQPTYYFEGEISLPVATGKQIVNIGFRPSIIEITCRDATTTLSIGTSRCTGAEGSIDQHCVMWRPSVWTTYAEIIRCDSGGTVWKAELNLITSYGFELDWQTLTNTPDNIWVKAWG